MTEVGQVYRCEICGNTVKVLEAGKGTLVCCGKEMLLINGNEENKEMTPWVCGRCGYIYNPQKGDKKGKIPAGVCFEDLNEDWVCPLCGASKKHFSEMLGYE